MNWRRTMLFSLILAVSLTLALVLRAQEKPPDAAPDKTFAGRIIAVSLKGTESQGAVLEEMRLRKLGDRTFLVGKGVDTGLRDDWRAGLTVWIAFDDIAQIVEFDNVAQMRR